MKTNIGLNDDYACIYTQGEDSWSEDKTRVSFYFGYEAENDDGEWCFKVAKGEEILCTIPQSELIASSDDLSGGDDPAKFLLQGIYLYLTKAEL